MTALPERFPDLFGCARHRPAEVRTLTARQPLQASLEAHVTIAHGLAWSLAVAETLDGKPATLSDAVWESNVLREFGVDTRSGPLAAVQVWQDRDARKRALECNDCWTGLAALDDTVNAALVAKDPTLSAPTYFGPKPRCHWRRDSPASIARKVVEDLRRRSVLGEALIVLEGTARWDLVPKAFVYLQCALELDGSLLIEARRDFSYWKTTVPAAQQQRLEDHGFSTPDEPGRNFEILVGPDTTGESHIDTLARAITGFIEVFQPRSRRIKIQRLEGASPIDPDEHGFRYAQGQRRIDRRGRAELYDACHERREGLDGAGADIPTVLELIWEQSEAFGDLLQLAHMEEFFDTVDDLVVLVPMNDEHIRQLCDDPWLTPEDHATVVLRHTFRVTDQRDPQVPAFVAVDTIDPMESVASATVVLLSREVVTAVYQRSALVSIAGRDVLAHEAHTGLNGSIVFIDEPLEPPQRAELLIPEDLG